MSSSVDVLGLLNFGLDLPDSLLSAIAVGGACISKIHRLGRSLLSSVDEKTLSELSLLRTETKEAEEKRLGFSRAAY